MRIAMVGGGYVGLVSGACFAEFGADVIIVESDVEKLAALQSGEIPIYEPRLEEIVARNAAEGRLSFSSQIEPAISDVEAVFIAVGTPSRRGDGHADLTFVFDAARQIAQYARSGLVVVTKSTVPVGAGRQISRILHETRPEFSFEVAANPEFLREGSAIDDFLRPDRVIIGVEQRQSRSEAVLRELYHPLIANNVPCMFTDLESAELTKYAANAFLAMKVTFANEMSDLCEKVGANIEEVARGIGLDSRIGGRFLRPGPGFGGSCFPKDTRALAAIAAEAGSPSRLIEATISVNEARKSVLTRRIVNLMGGTVEGKTIGVLGLTFKPDTDDMRESPSTSILTYLDQIGATIKAHDPQGMRSARALLPSAVQMMDSAYAVAENADALVVLTEWPIFQELEPARLKDVMRGNLVIDLRNMWQPEAMRRAGFDYASLGR